jgi:hypothetical protein
MFFRTKSIKGASLLQLVESYRNTERQPRQRVVVSLGDAKVPDVEKPTIARAVENHLLGQSDLLPPDLSEEAAGWVRRILQLAGRSKSARPVSEHTIDGVIIDRVETENVVQFGPQLVALEAWKRLGMGTILEEAGLNPSQIATAQLLVANRLIEPSSEWALVDWAERTALPEMLDLRASESDLFGAHGSIVLYDITNTHFEGLCNKNPKARHRKNKQKRNDCRQVASGMAFDSRGLALANDVFEGNIAETKTLATMLDRLAVPGTETSKPIVILDAGFASKKSIALLKERGLGYVINITRSAHARYAEELATGGFETVPGREGSPPVEVKSITDPDDTEGALVLCRSALRREKEAAMLSGRRNPPAQRRHRPAQRIETGKLKDPDKIERAIGKLQKKHPRAARLYTHCLVTTVLPLNTGTVLRIRKPSQPDAEQQNLYDNLGIDSKAGLPRHQKHHHPLTTL